MRFKGVAEGQFSKLVEAKDTRQNEADITDFIISLKEKYYSPSFSTGLSYCLDSFL
jgi:hypothetical protein